MKRSHFTKLSFTIAFTIIMIVPLVVRADINKLKYISEIASKTSHSIVLDTRPLNKCETESLVGARCLPATDFLGPHIRLAGFADIAWVLGSSGLTGKESVLVVGRDPTKRDFVAGLIYLMGQAHVTVLTKALNLVKAPKEQGQERATIRTAIWQVMPRNKSIIFKHELNYLLTNSSNQVLLDGRPEKSYWGQTVNAIRGGHLPGADHLPARRLRSDIIRGQALGPSVKGAIVYAQHAVDSIAFMTLIIAGTGTPVRVYTGGWAEWAADGGLPVDAESFPTIKLPILKGS